MKNPLRYQITEYDCGPTSMLNAMSFLFDREEIPPEVVRSIMIYCLDSFGVDGISGKSGTSHMAMMFLANWLAGFGKTGHLPISARYITGEQVNFSQNGPIRDALCRNGAAVARVDLEGWHYVLLTGAEGDRILLFDPYYLEKLPADPNIQVLSDPALPYNRAVPASYFERGVGNLYAFGPVEEREAVLLFNERTKLTEENTVEYII